MGKLTSIYTEQTLFCRSEVSDSPDCLYWKRFKANTKRAAVKKAEFKGWTFNKNRWACPACNQTKDTK